MMYLGQNAVGLNSPPPNIRQSIVTIDNNTTTITFPVISKPWGFLISCNNDDNTTKIGVKRISGMWSEYGSGGYIGGRFAVTRGNTYDHYNLPNTSIVYDDNAKTFSITVNSGSFYSGETYYLWYFTIPFNT